MQIYALTDPRDGAIRYIGKANDAQKRLVTHRRDGKRGTRPVHLWLRELVRLGMIPGLTVLAECCEDDWREQECAAIAAERVVNSRLLNVADGGNQPGEPKDPQLNRLWRAKKPFMQLMPKDGLSEECKTRIRARVRRGFEHVFNEDGSLIDGSSHNSHTGDQGSLL